MKLILLSISLVGGILLGSDITLPPWFLAFATVPLLFMPLTRRKNAIVTVSLCTLAVLGGIIRYQSILPSTSENRVEFYNNKGTAVIEGIIASGPDVRSTNAQLEVAVSEVNSRKVTGKVLLFVPCYPAYEYGDVLKVTGELETPAMIEDFDYKGYLAGRGITSVVYYPAIGVLETGKGFRPLGWLYNTRKALAGKMAEVLPEPQASLAQGIILGIRSEIPQSVKDDFMRTGTTHVLAISGQNLSIVAGMFIATGIWLLGKKRYLYIWLALAGIWGYASLTGLQAPVVRAAIMLSLFLFADLLGRQRSVLPALAFAAAVMLIITPALLKDASFQLSFLSILGLVLVAPFLQSSGHNIITSRLGEEGALVSALGWAIDCLSVTIGVTIVIWPVTAQYFGIFSIVSPLATFLVLPALAPIIVTCSLAGILGLIVPPLGQAAGCVAWLFLSYMLTIVGWFANLSVAAIDLKLSPLIIFTYFAILALVIWSLYKKEKTLNIFRRITGALGGPSKRFVVPALLVIAVLTTLFASSIPDDRFRVSVLDIGQGDAILLQQGLQDILVDGGPSGQSIAVELSKKLPFWDRTIELLVLTHPHADHLTGLLEVLKRYKVKHVLYTDWNSTSPLWAEWQDLV
jgi:competence protein ComEC